MAVLQVSRDVSTFQSLLRALNYIPALEKGTDLCFVTSESYWELSEEEVSRSLLLLGLINDAESDGDVRLALSMPAIQAWTTCAKLCAEGVPSADTYWNFDDRGSSSDDTLVAALLAAEFLQDNEMTDVLYNMLSQQFIASKTGAPYSSRGEDFNTRCSIEYVPTKAHRPRVLKIAQAVPEETLSNIMAWVYPCTLPLADQQSESTQIVQWNVITYLFLLLPPSYHPAILKARLPDIHISGSLIIPFLPWHIILDDSGPEHASLLTQVLSAAAVLAGGQPHLIWNRESRPGIPPHLQLSSSPVPIDDIKRKRRRNVRAKAEDGGHNRNEQHAATAPGPQVDAACGALATSSDETSGDGAEAMLTRLAVTIGWGDEYRGAHEVPVGVWARALVQLQSLVSLEIRLRVDDTSYDGCLAVLWSALSELPGVTQLALASLADMCSSSDCCRSTRRALNAVSALQQLQDLSLFDCVQCWSYGAKGDPESAEEAEERDCAAIAGLARLTRLTRLSLRRARLSPRCSHAAAKAIEFLPDLEELDVGETSPVTASAAHVPIHEKEHRGGELGPSPTDPLDPLVLNICRSVHLSSLRSLRMRRTIVEEAWEPARRAAVTGGSLTGAGAAAYRRRRWPGIGGPVLDRLTGLDLSDNGLTSSDLGILQWTLETLTGLRDLDVSGNEVPVGRLFASVLCRMASLTSLNISRTQCPLEETVRLLEMAHSRVSYGQSTRPRLHLKRLVMLELPVSPAAGGHQCGTGGHGSQESTCTCVPVGTNTGWAKEKLRFCSALRQLTSLEDLHLSLELLGALERPSSDSEESIRAETPPGDMHEVLQALAELPSLHSLDVGRVPVGSICEGSPVTEALAYMSQLTRVSLSACLPPEESASGRGDASTAEHEEALRCVIEDAAPWVTAVVKCM